jgi:hypothetical protein
MVDYVTAQLTTSSLTVGVTNYDPNVVAPSPSHYAICSRITNGLVSNGSTVSVQCPPGMPPSRYLIVNKQAVGAMTICELEVYAQGENSIVISFHWFKQILLRKLKVECWNEKQLNYTKFEKIHVIDR